MRKKYLNTITAIVLVFMMMPLSVWAADDQENSSVIEMTQEEAEYYLQLYGKSAINPRSSVFFDLTLGVLKEDSRLMVVYSTNLTETASEVGTKEIMLEVKSGLFWVPVAKLGKACRTNARTHSGGFYYNDPVKGSTYRAAAIHYAIINGTEHTSYACTNGTTF